MPFYLQIFMQIFLQVRVCACVSAYNLRVCLSIFEIVFVSDEPKETEKCEEMACVCFRVSLYFRVRSFVLSGGMVPFLGQ